MEEQVTPLPSEIFLEALTSEVNKEDVRKMVESQRHMLSRFEKTNEMLLNFNVLSKSRYESTQKEFRKHTLLLNDMKKDLDSVFKRIRVLKSTLGKQYPEAFSACGDVYDVIEDEEEEAELEVSSSASQVTLSAEPSTSTSTDTVTADSAVQPPTETATSQSKTGASGHPTKSATAS